ncbi:MAG TPA: ScyD/ScyE family protein [Ktedonobacterales bacterium]|jgi:hypothetical protein
MNHPSRPTSFFHAARARTLAAGVVALAVLLFQSTATTTRALAEPSAGVTVFATGLNNPRGLTFGPGGKLYVAEGGTGGSTSTVGLCTQVIPPVGPYTGGFTARVSVINREGVRATVADGLPSSQTSPALGSLVSGVAALQFVGGKLYALLAGAGCSHGIVGVPNGILRIGPDGQRTLVANLSEFIMRHPVANPNPDDFEPDGTWFSMVRVGHSLFAVEPNHGELDKITLKHDGTTATISRVADISASQGHIVPTAVAYHDGDFYVANLNTFPTVPGSSKLLRISPRGEVKVVLTGLTAVVGLAFHEGSLYALEMSTAANGPTPGNGAVVRINDDGTTTPIISGLTFPTAMAFGPDGKLYISTFGFGFPPGAGQIVRVTLPSD